MGFDVPEIPPIPEPPPPPPVFTPNPGANQAQQLLNRRMEILATSRGGTLSGSTRGVESDSRVLAQSLVSGSALGAQ